MAYYTNNLLSFNDKQNVVESIQRGVKSSLLSLEEKLISACFHFRNKIASYLFKSAGYEELNIFMEKELN